MNNGSATLHVVKRFNSKKHRGVVYQGDALAFLRKLKSDSAAIVFLDPPFNLGKVYDKRRSKLDRMPEKEYRRWIEDILDEAVRVLKPGGALYMYHIPRWAVRFGAYLMDRLEFQHWIAVSMKNGFARGRRLYPAHYALLHFTKGEARVLRRPRIAPATCRHCSGLIHDYGGYAHIISRNKGVNLSDFWDDLSPVRHAKHKHRKANELPHKMLERIMAISGAPSLLCIDPFAGTGSAIKAAVRAGLKFAACDLYRSNCRLICQSLILAPNRNLKTKDK
ncbi:MAG: DNA methyltransferase [bacterium]|nr:DNA methyltransferase [bacterium]